jgi:hypothetical protein
MEGYFGDAKIAYLANSDGANGDGSSGPCAYVAKEVPASTGTTFDVKESDGATVRIRHFTETRDPKYASAAGENALEPFKYAKTTIYFEDRSRPIESGSKQWSALTNCRNVRFGCE